MYANKSPCRRGDKIRKREKQGCSLSRILYVSQRKEMAKTNLVFRRCDNVDVDLKFHYKLNGYVAYIHGLILLDGGVERSEMAFNQTGMKSQRGF